MQASRAGTFLTTDIRIALSSLGRDPFEKKVERMTVAEKRAYLATLRAEQRRMGGILKKDHDDEN